MTQLLVLALLNADPPAPAIVERLRPGPLGGGHMVVDGPGGPFTRFVEPKRADGTIDWLEAHNRIASAGVTPEDNQVVTFIRLGGVIRSKEPARTRLLDRLGVPPALREEIPTTIWWHNGPHHYRKLMDDLGDCENATWRGDDRPEFLEALRGASGHGEIILEASRRAKVFCPMVPVEPGFVDDQLDGIREVGCWLMPTIMLAIGEGQLDEAERWIEIGRMTADRSLLRPLTIGDHRAVTFHADLNRAELHLLWARQPTVTEIGQRLRKHRAAGPRSYPVGMTADLSARAVAHHFLDELFESTAWGREAMDHPLTKGALEQLSPDGPWPSVAQVMAGLDRLDRAKTPGERLEIHRLLDAAFDRRVRLLRSGADDIRWRVWREGDWLETLSPVVDSSNAALAMSFNWQDSFNRQHAAHEMMLALIGYRLERGRWPVNLTDLVPGWMDKAPDLQRLKIVGNYEVEGDSIKLFGLVPRFPDRVAPRPGPPIPRYRIKTNNRLRTPREVASSLSDQVRPGSPEGRKRAAHEVSGPFRRADLEVCPTLKNSPRREPLSLPKGESPDDPLPARGLADLPAKGVRSFLAAPCR